MRLLWIAVAVLVADQVTKLAVRFYMGSRSIAVIGDWLQFTYTENPGMAFGILSGSTIIVTACSIAATALIVIYLFRVRSGYTPYTTCLTLILGGAIGNIVDRLFYGVIFDYAPVFRGRVVDFIHFNFWSGLVPESVPLIGGQYMTLFPIFNVADIAICGGVAGVLIFQRRFQKHMLAQSGSTEEAVAAPLPD